MLMLAGVCEVCGRTDAMGWPGAVMWMGIAVAVAVVFVALGKYA